MDIKNALFLIESGPALDLVQRHIAERVRVKDEVNVLATELGAERISADRLTGVLLGVVFKDKIHPDFTKPRRVDGASFPKKKTAWAKRFAAQTGHENQTEAISRLFNIPLSLNYSNGQGSEGVSMIGSPFQECGFLYLGKEGPYAMWVPDVPAYVAEYEKKRDCLDESKVGYTVEEPAKSFKLEFDGCRRMLNEEWELMVAQHNLNQKRRAAVPAL